MNTIAWAAGLFEGEGSIVSFGARKHQRSLTLAMTDEDVVFRFAAIFGVGKVYGPYSYKNDSNRRREHHKQYWRWSVSDKEGVTTVAKMLLPFMGQRRSAILNEAIEAVALLKESTRGRLRQGH